jgi:hypothetical protein
MVHRSSNALSAFVLFLLFFLITTACGTSSQGGGAACSASSDCASGKVCGFLESAACAAKGECVAPPEVSCSSRYDVCACDGKTTFATGCGFPSGYVSTPYATMGACGGDAGADAGASDAGGIALGDPCDPQNNQCAGGLRCCYTSRPVTGSKPVCAAPGAPCNPP